MSAALFGTMLFGSALNAGTNALNRYLSGQQTDYDRQENYRLGEMAAGAADARTRALYSDFYSPQALLRQYKEAGLSPSLMFGGTPGQGGTAGAQGTGASGIQTPYMPISLIEGAQVANIMAQTKKTEAETKVINGENTRGIAEIKNILEEAGQKKAAAAAAEAEAAGLKLDNYVKEHTKDASIYQICEMAEEQAHKTEYMYQEMRSAKVLANLNEELYETNVEIGRKRLEELTTAITEAKSRTKLNEQQKQYLRNEVLVSFDTVAQKWKELDIKDRQQNIYEDWINAQIPVIEKQLEVRFKELKLQNTKLYVDAAMDLIKAAAMGAMAASSMGYKPGQNSTTPIPQQPGRPSQPFN